MKPEITRHRLQQRLSWLTGQIEAAKAKGDYHRIEELTLCANEARMDLAALASSAAAVTLCAFVAVAWAAMAVVVVL